MKTFASKLAPTAISGRFYKFDQDDDDKPKSGEKAQHIRNM